jgi:hypothetical protein
MLLMASCCKLQRYSRIATARPRRKLKMAPRSYNRGPGTGGAMRQLVRPGAGDADHRLDVGAAAYSEADVSTDSQAIDDD